MLFELTYDVGLLPVEVVGGGQGGEGSGQVEGLVDPLQLAVQNLDRDYTALYLMHQDQRNITLFCGT